MVEFLWCCGPPFATALAAFCIHAGLRERRMVAGLWLAAGVAIPIGICYELFTTASYPNLGSLAACFIGLFCACVALLSAGWLAWSLKGQSRFAALALGVGFPLAMWFSIEAGEARSPESVTRRNGDRLVQTLARYHKGVGQYPSDLAALVPGWLVEQPEALTTQHTGWLYTGSAESFTLGYWYWPEKLGSWVCLYDSGTPQWECDLNHWGPFEVVPTRIPCRNPEGEWVGTADCQ